MFGYVKPDFPYLYMKDNVLQRAMYCGLCKGIGKCCGNCARMTLSFDMSFFSALAHNIAGIDVEIKKERCIAHWFMKRAVAQPDALTERIAALNVIMAYWKVCDDIADNGKGKFKRLFLRRAYKKALKHNADLDDVVRRKIVALSALEKQNCDSVDRVADCFASMMEEAGSRIVGKEKATDEVKSLFYNVGKWVYLIDAMDDYDKDAKTGNYNPFRYAYAGAKTRAELWAKHGNEIAYVFDSLFGCIREDVQNVKFAFNHDLTDNILLRGMPRVTASVINKEYKKCKKSMKYSG